jgi:hypothetical protein
VITQVLEAHEQETGSISGTDDKDYNLVWFLQQCLSNTIRLEIYMHDAERAGDTELAAFFGRAQGESRKGAEQSRRLLHERLAERRPSLHREMEFTPWLPLLEYRCSG